ncbi:alpha/beta fold hydrolase [Acidisarcina polymorpha]|uniref:alpha/beta fold hydrolase n=1 Tax=Acidisarcina polymorpha TaxID=2211140 RepID=UPI001375214A|nr:alpha/beta hydrolase [Acidisarcina polymorpha]
MQNKLRDSVPLAFSKSGDQENALLLIHGWGCDHTTLLRQQTFFEHSHTVINVDLRGHGESGAPEAVYSIAQYADDVMWLCGELGITRVAVVGHSMGGAVALEMGYRNPALVEAVAMLDTAFQAPSSLNNILGPLVPGLMEAGFEATYRSIMRALSLPSDLPALDPVLESFPKATQHVLLSSLKGHMEDHNFAAAAAGCTVPVAYIGAAQPLADLVRLRELIPELMIGRTVGAGHFAPLLVHDQVDAMLLRFLTLVRLDKSASMEPDRSRTVANTPQLVNS